MSQCRSTFESVQPGREWSTHTCCLRPRHDGPHICPTCSAIWITEPTTRPNHVLR